MRLKEAFLKVQGAKEMLGIIKTASKEKDEAILPEQLAALISAAKKPR